jgi:hypothetical protein
MTIDARGARATQICLRPLRQQAADARFQRSAFITA